MLCLQAECSKNNGITTTYKLGTTKALPFVTTLPPLFSLQMINVSALKRHFLSMHKRQEKSVEIKGKKNPSLTSPSFHMSFYDFLTQGVYISSSTTRGSLQYSKSPFFRTMASSQLGSLECNCNNCVKRGVVVQKMAVLHKTILHL